MDTRADQTVRESTVRESIDGIYRRERARVFSTLIRLLGDFDLAEDSLQAAFTAAVEQWARDGIPGNPRAWLVSTGRFQAIGVMRRDRRLFAALQNAAPHDTATADPMPECEDSSIEDDRLRLIFACCHPALSRESQVALTLREVCGLSTEEIARAFLTSAATVAQRIVRGKAKIRARRIPYEVPRQPELAERTDGVLQVIYLLFSEGYYASAGESLSRQSLSGEAIRLGRLVAELLPEPEVIGLLALMLLQESRRSARVSEAGDVILLPNQDRSLWNDALIAEGHALTARALRAPAPGPYALQAGIAAAHVEGALSGETDWAGIVAMYEQLLAIQPSPIVELNRAVALSYRDGPATALAVVDELLDRGELDGYGLAHATRADLCRRLSRLDDAARAYGRALEITEQSAERRFLEGRLREVNGSMRHHENL